MTDADHRVAMGLVPPMPQPRHSEAKLDGLAELIRKEASPQGAMPDTTPKRLRWKWGGDVNPPLDLHAQSNVDTSHYNIDDASGKCTAWHQGDYLAEGTLTEMFHACQQHDDAKIAQTGHTEGETDGDVGPET